MRLGWGSSVVGLLACELMREMAMVTRTFLLPPVRVTFTNLRVYWILFFARPLGVFFFSCFSTCNWIHQQRSIQRSIPSSRICVASFHPISSSSSIKSNAPRTCLPSQNLKMYRTFGVWDLTFPARARDPWTFPIFAVYRCVVLGDVPIWRVAKCLALKDPNRSHDIAGFWGMDAAWWRGDENREALTSWLLSMNRRSRWFLGLAWMWCDYRVARLCWRLGLGLVCPTTWLYATMNSFYLWFEAISILFPIHVTSASFSLSYQMQGLDVDLPTIPASSSSSHDRNTSPAWRSFKLINWIIAQTVSLLFKILTY